MGPGLSLFGVSLSEDEQGWFLCSHALGPGRAAVPGEGYLGSDGLYCAHRAGSGGEDGTRGTSAAAQDSLLRGGVQTLAV